MARPSFQANDERRDLVKSMAMLGMHHEQICRVIGVRSPKTLRKHFRSELTDGGLHAMTTVMKTAFKMAISGEYPAMTIFWEKCQRDLRAEREHEEAEQERLEALRRAAIRPTLFCAEEGDDEEEEDEYAD